MDINLKICEKIKIYEKQEAKLQFITFNNNVAWDIGSRIALRGMEDNLPIAIDITVNGYQLFRYGCIGTNIHNELWMKRKINMVTTIQKSSIHAAAILERDQLSIKDDWYLDPMNYASCGGCFPIILKGSGMIGTICVSGLKDYEDHQIIIDTLEEYLRQ